jgi:hypothetical protein
LDNKGTDLHLAIFDWSERDDEAGSIPIELVDIESIYFVSGSNRPDLGKTVNSLSDSGVNVAVKSAAFFVTLASLKETLVVLFKGEVI